MNAGPPAAGVPNPSHYDFADAFLAKLVGVLGKIPNLQRGLLLHAPTLTAKATTAEEYRLLRAEALSFAAFLVGRSRFTGAWFVSDVGADGRHHVHGLVVSPRPVDDIVELWAGHVTNASAAAQHNRKVGGQSVAWKDNKTLRSNLGKWVRYCLKPVAILPEAPEQRVCAVAGRLVMPWAEACVSVVAGLAKSAGARRCRCGAALTGRQRMHCSKSCANAASRRRAPGTIRPRALVAVKDMLEDGHVATTKELIAAVKHAGLQASPEQVRALLTAFAQAGWIVDHGRRNCRAWAWRNRQITGYESR